MRTLGLLAALLLLALPGQADPLREAAQQVPDLLDQPALTAEQASDAEDQVPVMDQRDQPEDKDEDIAVSFYGNERLTREAKYTDHRVTCYCRAQQCRDGEWPQGSCGRKRKLSLCCRRRSMY